jgi:hypothetical protein
MCESSEGRSEHRPHERSLPMLHGQKPAGPSLGMECDLPLMKDPREQFEMPPVLDFNGWRTGNEESNFAVGYRQPKSSRAEARSWMRWRWLDTLETRDWKVELANDGCENYLRRRSLLRVGGRGSNGEFHLPQI